MEISLRRLRDLTLDRPSGPGHPLHLSAASGLVATPAALFVVADDEKHLGVFPRQGSTPGTLVRLFDGALPDAKPDRKKRKPDLECLTALPGFAAYPHGALLGLGSGSTAARRRGFLAGLESGGRISGSPRTISLADFFEPLDALFSDLNLEGATVRGDELLLFQRGHTDRPENFALRYDLAPLLSDLANFGLLKTPPAEIVPLELGSVASIPFSVTDAASLPDGRTIVTAVAEDTASTYDDGACVGALVALLDEQLRLLEAWPLDRPHKIEGVSAVLVDSRIDLLLVTDADDPDVQASLYAATVMDRPSKK